MRLPGDVIGKTGDFKMRQAAFADGGFQNWTGFGCRTGVGRDARLHPRDAGATTAIHCRRDFFQRGGLRRIQRQRLRRQNVFAGIGIALGNLRGDFHQAAVFEFADGRGGRLGQFDQFLQRQFAPFLDDVPDFLLAFRQFGKFAGHRQRADKKPFAPAGFLLAHGLGQNGFQRDFRRAAVIVRNPAREFQNLRRHESRAAGRAGDPQNGFKIGAPRILPPAR